MSSNVRSYGFIAKLIKPYSKADREAFDEQLYDAGSILRINYEGSLAYMDFNSNKSYSEREEIYFFTVGTPKDASLKDFLTECTLRKVEIDTSMIMPFNCIWYNGSDSPMSELELAQFELSIIDESLHRNAAMELLL